jgi:hypothetical protein
MKLPAWTIWVLGVCVFLIACLETPDSPEVSSTTPEILICISQTDSSCSTPLQASPTEPFTLQAKVSPSSVQSELSFKWILASGKTLKTGTTFETDTSQVPDSLIVTDDYKNRLSFALDFIFDTAPVLSSQTVPAKGDTLLGDSTTAFLFEYSATDADKGDSLVYTLVLDSTEYFAAALTSVYQSGFAVGEHRFRVFVQDVYGLQDSTDWVTFTVQEEE